MALAVESVQGSDIVPSRFAESADGLGLVQAVLRCEEMIAAGSKSFSLASRLFDQKKRAGAVQVYGWCRHSDDRIDGSTSPEEVGARLRELQSLTLALYLGRLPEQLQGAERDIYLAFGSVLSERRIPAYYPLELLEGMAMDARGEAYPTFHKLKLYCFRVAGTVGLMMSHVMGLKREDALGQAVELGIAMQLTNIARDIKEDYGMGRVYLPEEWLLEENLTVQNLFEPESRAALFRVVQRLVAQAEGFYDSGLRGVAALPLRAAFAVQAAALIYREIGRRLLTLGPGGLDQRTVVSTGRKVWLAVFAVVQVLGTLPTRLTPLRSFQIPMSVWRFDALNDSSKKA